MKPKDDIEKLFGSLGHQWDNEEPGSGHQQRFLNKLEMDNSSRGEKSNRNVWKLISIAASLALLVTIGVQFFQQQNELQQQQTQITNKEVAAMPISVRRTEFYFSALVDQEIEKINNISSPKTKKLVDDLKAQLTKLENDYKNLETDLNSKGDVKLILNAMMINFQTRINLAQDVLQKIEEIEQLKNTKHEEHTI
ncbi:hypothetical protein [Galbibacter sp.]|jgi:hypothetical protein|uniref:hypothetical protein n=1 Tax=Galbibacter sp. TaxID=2918471 RepID=UPI003A91E919